MNRIEGKTHDSSGARRGAALPRPPGRLAGLLAAVALVGCETAGPEPGHSTEALQALPPSLSGSSFEIDTNANLVVNQTGTIDWASVTELRQHDTPSGQSDDSYKGGSKEDDLCPGIDTGSIPNNKSDLKTFGLYKEPGSSVGSLGMLHLFWTRVLPCRPFFASPGPPARSLARASTGRPRGC